MVNAIMSSFIVNAIMVLLWLLSWETLRKCLELTRDNGELNRDGFSQWSHGGRNLEARKQTRIQAPDFITTFRCHAAKCRCSNKVEGGSSRVQVVANLQPRRQAPGLSPCVPAKPGEAVSLCDRQRRVFDPGYLASSTLPQPLEPSQGN